MKTGLDLLTILWTTEVLINNVIYEQQPRVLLFNRDRVSSVGRALDYCQKTA